MNVDEYINLALRTEKRVDALGGEEDGQLWGALETVVEACRLADLLKKLLVYGKDVPLDDIVRQLDIVRVSALVSVDHWIAGENNRRPLRIHGRLGHAALGGIGEWGELLDALMDDADNVAPLQNGHLVEEVGDAMWYQALALDVVRDLGIASPDSVLLANIRKLQARYPERFTLRNSNDRDVGAERAAIEGAL